MEKHGMGLFSEHAFHFLLSNTSHISIYKSNVIFSFIKWSQWKNNGSETLMSHENEKNMRVSENCLKEHRHKKNQAFKECQVRKSRLLCH